jgi:capsular exopolysaccharide synthesis family protein
MLGPANGRANGNGRHGRFVHAGENGNGKRQFRRTAERLVTLDGTPSPGSEAYRMLQTNLAFSPLTGTRRIFVVASAMQGEGKTLTAANVAVSFAVDGMRVLLIDGDMRHARQHRLFELQRAPGLTDILAGRVTTAEAIQATGVEQLFVLPSGTREPRPGEVVKSARMQGLLDEVAKSFDVVIIDTPPVMAVADALILGALADGVLFVVRAGITSRELLRDAVQQLETVGAHVIGTVLNDPAGEATTYVGQYYATVAQA